MIKKLTLLIWFGTIGLSSYGQDIGIRGLIIDAKTEDPVPEAHVSTTAGAVAVTDESGHFYITITKLPATLLITHVSYGTTKFEVKTEPDGVLVFRLNRAVTNLGEVQITGERMRILTKNDQYSIQEFAIDQGVIWFLGFINNQANLQRLFLANLYGDTLASIPVKRAESLFQDVFQNVHIVFNDSVCQLYHPEGNEIEFLYTVPKNRFFDIMAGIEVALDQKLVYCRTIGAFDTRQVYYIQKDDPVRYQLAVLSDSAESSRVRTARKMDPMMARWGVPELANMWTTVYRYSKRGTKFEQVIRHQVPYELFKSGGKLFLINYLKDSLLSFTADGGFEKAIPIDFHKEISPGGTDYKDLTCLTDAVTQKVFMLEHETTRWMLFPFDTRTGKTGSQVQLPDYPGMDGICVYDNAVYFFYPEKLHPYYNRLYRYQL